MKRTVAVVAFLVAVLPPSIRAQPAARGRATPSARADELLRIGVERYEAGDFEAAISAFAEGHALDPRPMFLFATAQAERRSGDCAAAIDFYDRFLETSPTESQAAAARDQRERCARALEPAPAPEVEPVIVSPPSPASPRPAPRRWYADPLTDALVGGASLLAITGVAFSLSASGAIDDANGATTYQAYDDASERASSYRTIGLITLAGGAALGAVAAWRIVRHDPAQRERPEAPRASLGPGPGVGASLRGAF